MNALRLLAFLALFAGIAAGQSFTSLNGRVTDASGGAVAGAVVEILNLDTALKRSILSDESGLYSFSQVAPGRYRVTAKAAGFAAAVVDDVNLVINTPSTIAIRLEVGSVSETVSVNSEAVQVNTVDASLGNAVTNEAIVQLPFEARNPASLLALQPGVTYFGQGSTYGRPVTGQPSTADRLSGSVNGSKPDQNNITLDGVDVNDQNTRNAFQSVLRVTLDSVQEFRTTTQNPTAEQGRGSGAQIALVTKSGTNALHGSLYEYHRNTLTSANSFFNNRSGVPRQKLIRNTFGASAGGPLKKDRLFYFANFEGRRDASDGTATRTVPTASFRQGIIQYLNKSGGVSTLTPEQLKQIDPAGIGVDPAVLQVLNQYPLPNDNTIGDGFNTAGYRFKASQPVKLNTYIARVDYRVDGAGKNTVFWRGNLQNDNLGGLPQFPGQAPASVTLDNSKGYGAGWTSLLTPRMVSTFRYGYTRSGHETTGIQSSPYVDFRGLSTLQATTKGLTRIIPVHQFSEDLSWSKGRHDLRFGGIVRLIRNTSTNFATAYPSGEVTYSYLAGTGASLKPGDLSSSFSTPYRTAAVDLLGPVSFGDVTYNYLLDGSVLPFGTPVRRKYVGNEFEWYVNDSWRMAKNLTVTAGLRYSLTPAIHEANGFQVSPNVDLGDWFATRGNLANAGLSQALAGPVGFVLSSSAQGHPLYDTPKKNFSPRLALAYSPRADSGLGRFLFGGEGKTSIRAGFGMFYDLFGMSLMRNFDSNAPGLSTEFQTPASASLATNARFTGYTAMPAGLLPSAPKGGFPYYAPSDVDHGFAISNSIDQHLKQPYTMNLNFSIGREFSHGLFVQGSYVGRLSRRSLVVTDLAQPTNLKDPKSGITYYQAVNELARAARAGVPTSQIKTNAFWEDVFPGYAGGGLTATQGIYDTEFSSYPTDITSGLLDIDELCDGSTCSTLGPNSMFNAQYASLFAYRSIGKGYYHAMQWTVRKRFSDGLLFDFNYTLSKSIDLTSNAEADFGGSSYAVLLNPYNTALNKGVSDYDVRHSFSGFAVYQLPIGKGKKLLGSANKVVDAFLGGWQLSGLYTITSGLPRSVNNSGSWPTNWNYSGFATQIGPVPASSTTRNAPGIDGSSGPNIFADPAAARAGFDYSYAGDAGQRNGIRGDGFFTVDLSLGKRFVMPYKDTHSIQFRWETFNAPNAVRFDVNSASLDVGNTGTFGKYTGLLTQPRVMQFGLRYEF
jgi:Carboxypeptidase regulatory-like domain